MANDKKLDKKLIDQLLADYKEPEDITGENGLLKRLTKAILERAMQSEMTEHLGYEKHDIAGHNSGNSRNGSTRKKLLGNFGELELDTPRDRQGSFEPLIVAKGQNRFTGFDDKIISMYARGMSTREIQGHLEDIYGIGVSPTLISNVTDGVLEEVQAWQSSPLEAVYPIVYLDGLKGFPEAIEALFPRTVVQLCIVHMVRASMKYVSWKYSKQVVHALRLIYTATTVAEALAQLEAFEAEWKQYVSVSQVWRRNWDRITPMFNFPAEIRRAIYTTNAVESLNRSLRKVIKTRGSFPNEQAAIKLLFLAIRQASRKWTLPIH